MLGGEVLFFEVCDDFPKGAERAPQDGLPNSFVELEMVYPSKLPSDEINALRDSF